MLNVIQIATLRSLLNMSILGCTTHGERAAAMGYKSIITVGAAKGRPLHTAGPDHESSFGSFVEDR